MRKLLHKKGISDANVRGFKYQEKAIEIIKQTFPWEEDFGPRVLLKTTKLGAKYGVSFDYVYPKEGRPEAAVWITHLGKRQRVSNKHVERNLGEVLFLKRNYPNIKTVAVLFDIEHFFKYARGFYRAFWDTVITVSSDKTEIHQNLGNEVIGKILYLEINQKFDSKKHKKFSSTPTLKDLAINLLQRYGPNIPTSKNRLLVKAIARALDRAPSSIVDAINKKDWYIFDDDHPITWNFFNPLEGLITLRLDKYGYPYQWPPNGINVKTFLDDLKIDGPRIVEDISIKDKVFIQAKTLSKPSTGAKQAWYDVRRMAARAFLTRWRYINNQIKKLPISYVAVLDGFWGGPQMVKKKKEHAKYFDFLYEVAGYSDILLAQDLLKTNKLKNILHQIL